MYDWLLFLHLVAAFLLAVTVVMYSAVALGAAAPGRTLFVADRCWDVGGLGTLVLGAPATKVRNLERTAKRFGVAADEMVLIGDADVDATAAADFGCPFLRVRAAGHPPAPWPTGSIRAFAELPRAIGSLDRRASRV